MMTVTSCGSGLHRREYAEPRCRQQCVSKQDKFGCRSAALAVWSPVLMDRALTDQDPERITGHAVRDHRDRHTGVYRRSAADAAARLLRLTPGALAGEQGDYRSADGAIQRQVRRMPPSGRLRRVSLRCFVFLCVKERMWSDGKSAARRLPTAMLSRCGCGQRGDIPAAV